MSVHHRSTEGTESKRSGLEKDFTAETQRRGEDLSFIFFF
jgi:hypothetical protein